MNEALRLVPDAATVVGSWTRLWVSMHPPCDYERCHDMASFPSIHGVPGMAPRFNDTMGRSDSPAARLDPFDVFTSRYHRVARGLLPSVVGVPPGAKGLSVPVSPSGLTMETVEVSQVPWKPWWSLSVLFDPGRIRQAESTMS